MFPAYQEDREEDPPDIPSTPASEFSSFPKNTPQSQRRRDYAEEDRIKSERKRREALAKLNEKIERAKEDLTYAALRLEDSDEDDDEDYPFTIRTEHQRLCIATPNVSTVQKKHAHFVTPSGNTGKRKAKVSSSSPSSSSSSSSSSEEESSSGRSSRKYRKRKKKERKRRRQSSRDSRSASTSHSMTADNVAILFENSEKGSKARFRIKTKNMINFSNRDKDYSYLQEQRDAEKLSAQQLTFYSYYPDHANYLYERAYKGLTFNPTKCHIKMVLQDAENKELKWNGKNIVISERSLKAFRRYYQVKFSAEKYENLFRSAPLSNNVDFISISVISENYKHPWEIEEEKQRKKADEEAVSALRAAAMNEKQTVDNELLKIKNNIRKEPKVADHYIEFINKEEELFEKHKNEGLQTNDRTGLNERKLAILDEGIKLCPQSSKLALEKVGILKEHRPDEALLVWMQLLHTFPNDLTIREAYLDFIQFDSQIYSYEKMQLAFKNARLIMEGLLSGTFVSHKVLPGTRQFLIKIWIREIYWLFEQGYAALAIASLQASVEISLFYPTTCSNLSTRKKLFKSFWESGAPRIGDLFYHEGFTNYSPDKVVSNKLIKALEEKQIMDEYHENKDICTVLKKSTGDADGFVKLERALSNLNSRPLRFSHEHWNDSPKEVQDSIFDRKYVTFDELHLLIMEADEVMEVLGAFGIETHVSAHYANWFSAARNFGIQLIDDNIPPNAFLMLTRIFWHLVKSNYGNLLDLPKNFISCAERMHKSKKKINKTVSSFMKDLEDRMIAERNGHPVIDGITSDRYHILQFLFLKKMVAHDLLIHSTESVIRAASSMCILTVNNPNSLIYMRLALGYMTIAAEVLDGNTFLQNMIDWIGTWKKQATSTSRATERYIFVKETLEELICISSLPLPDELKDATALVPTLSASACTLLVHFYRSLNEGSRVRWETVSNLVEAFKNASNDAYTFQDVHYSLVLYLKKEWYEHHRNRERFICELHEHIKKFPRDYRAIPIALEYMKSRTSIAIPMLHKKELNPLSNCFCNDPLEQLYNALVVIALADRKTQEGKLEKMIDFILFKTIAKLAEKYKSPYLWKFALSKSSTSEHLETYVRASAQCRWSKELHLERILCNGTERALNESYSLMNEANILLHISPQDVDTYREMLSSKEKR